MTLIKVTAEQSICPLAVCAMLIVFRMSSLLPTLKHIGGVFKKDLNEAGKTRPSNLYFHENKKYFSMGKKGMCNVIIMALPRPCPCVCRNS